MTSLGRLPFVRRYLLLFLFVFLVPVALLTALAIQTVTQERELAVRRVEDDRRQLATAIRQEFLGRLEALKLRALSGNAVARQDDGTPDRGDPIVLVAPIVDGRLELPWEQSRTAADARRLLAEQPFATLVSHGESEELARQQPTTALPHYLK